MHETNHELLWTTDSVPPSNSLFDFYSPSLSIVVSFECNPLNVLFHFTRFRLRPRSTLHSTLNTRVQCSRVFELQSPPSCHARRLLIFYYIALFDPMIHNAIFTIKRATDYL
jgi:hypothetical protein